jgi:DNA transformation protein and related proteins
MAEDHMRNLGPVSLRMLADIGVQTLDDLRAMGALAAWTRLRFEQPPGMTMNGLYAMEAALRDCHWLALPAEVKIALKAEAAKVRAALPLDPSTPHRSVRR